MTDIKYNALLKATLLSSAGVGCTGTFTTIDTEVQHTVDVERFAGLNIRGFSSMKFFTEILSWCIGHQCSLLTYS